MIFKNILNLQVSNISNMLINKLLFRSDRGSNSSPLLGFDGRLYVGCSNGIVYAIQPEDGEIIWQQRIGSSIFFSSPRLSKERVLYIGSMDGPLFALDAKDNGKILWSMHTEKPFVGTPLITDGF